MHMYIFSWRKPKIHLLHFKEEIRSEAATNMTLNFILLFCYPSNNKEKALGDLHIPFLNSNSMCASKFLVTLKMPADLFAFR